MNKCLVVQMKIRVWSSISYKTGNTVCFPLYDLVETMAGLNCREWVRSQVWVPGTPVWHEVGAKIWAQAKEDIDEQ